MSKKAHKQPIAPKAQPLFESAIQKGDVSKVRELLAAGHKPEPVAARQAVDACVKAARTAKMTQAPLFGRMPSKKEQENAAVQADNYYEIAEALLEVGVAVPEALSRAARSGHAKLALLLIRHGADVHLGTPLENAVSAGSLEVVRALIKAGADIHHQGIQGTLLNRAVRENHLEVAKELIKAGVDVNAQPKFGPTVLLTAVTEQKGEAVTLLIESGANVNQKGTVVCGDFGEPEVEEEGMFRTTHVSNPPVARDASPLIVTSRLGYSDMAAQLIAGGADVEAVDNEGLSALVYALRAGDEPLIKLLKEAGAQAPKHAEGSSAAAWIAAAKAGDCDRLRALLADGIDVNLKHVSQDEPQGTALKNAAENGHLNAVKLLLAADAKADEKFGCEIDQQTALMHAAKAGHVEVAKTLIAAGAAVAAKDCAGTTVLHYAAEGGHRAMIEFLLRAGAKVEVKTKHGF